MTKPKQYSLKKILIFLFTGLVILTALSFIIDFGVRHSDLEQTGKVNKIMNHDVDPDIMIFGPSVSEVSISPAIIKDKTGLSAFNCSLNGTRFTQYRGLIDEFESYSKDNKYVVLVESYFSFEKTDVLMAAERYLAQIHKDNLYKSLYTIQPDLIWKSRYIPFYKYVAVTHEYYKNSFIGWRRILKRSNPADTLQGWDPVDRSWEVDQDEAMRQTAPFEIAIDSGIVKKYIELITKLKKDGKTVILLLSPPYTKVLNTITDFAPLRKELNVIAKETGSKFLDFTNSDICSDKTLFYNTNHLNIKGARIFSAMLADSLDTVVHHVGSQGQ